MKPLEQIKSEIGGLFLATGSMQTGKTVTAFRLVEILKEIYPDREVFYYYPYEEQFKLLYHHGLPRWIEAENELFAQKLDNNSIIIYDEAATYFNSKNFKKGEAAEKLALMLSQIKQRRQHVFVLIQNFGELEKAFFKYADVMIFKYLTPSARATEREDINEIIRLAQWRIEREMFKGVDKRKIVAMYGEDARIHLYTITPPSFFVPDLSRLWQFAGKEVEAE